MSSIGRGLIRTLGLVALAWSGSLIGCSTDSSADPRECQTGQQGCVCEVGATCDQGLLCEQGMCVATASVTLNVQSAKARGCEVLLEDRSQVVSVEFTNEVQGVFIREAPRTGVAFIAGSDSPIPSGSVRINYQDDGSGLPEVAKVNCTDTDGAALKDSEVSLGG